MIICSVETRCHCNSYEIIFGIFQEEPIGTRVIQVFASDANNKTNGEVTYSIGNIGCGV